MNAFNQIIGYDNIKQDLMQLCDMISHKEVYRAMGARLPHGLLLSGEPGLGKTLMCRAFIEESGLPSFTLRRSKADFLSTIADAFNKAKECTPSIVFLDDLDKFANDDPKHQDSAEYVAVQAAIDDVYDMDVFVLATANDTRKLPSSLLRPGRFDRCIEISTPSEADAEAIISFYLSQKQVAKDVNTNDLTKMITYSSCAELETILNEAAIRAAYHRKSDIDMSDLVSAVLRMQYNSPDESYKPSDDDETKRVALHEAGHLVCSEVLNPGSVGFVSIRPSHKTTGGLVHKCKNTTRRPVNIITALAAKAAVELYFADHVASGCSKDIQQAFTLIRDGMAQNATAGFGMLDTCTHQFPDTSESLNSRHEAVAQALLEKYYLQAKDILIKNRDFLEKAADELQKNCILLYSDIQRIKAEFNIAYVEIN